MPTARASHILVSSEKACSDLKDRISEGLDFAEAAKTHSTCPSAKKGGDLGSFGPGEMVREFDEVVFHKEVGTVHGPVKTRFGWHLVRIDARTE